MSNEKEDFSLESILKKVQDGDTTLLIVAAILVIIPAIFLFFLVGEKTDKKITQQKFRSMTQRRNVFNFKREDYSNSSSSSSSSYKGGNSSTSNSSWFSSKTPEQIIEDELAEASRIIEQKSQEIVVPSGLEGYARDYYLAENNYNLSMGNSALDTDNYEEAEKYLYKALEEAEGNPFLTVKAWGSICALYEKLGDKKKMEEAYKQYIEAVSNIPPEYGGFDLKKSVRDAYKSLESLGKYASESELSDALSKTSLAKSGAIPQNLNVRNIYKDFPIKYE